KRAGCSLALHPSVGLTTRSTCASIQLPFATDTAACHAKAAGPEYPRRGPEHPNTMKKSHSKSGTLTRLFGKKQANDNLFAPNPPWILPQTSTKGDKDTY
ncbi:hypothetical protein NDU88_004848, partial [Pleurodeles waltl]